MTAALAATAFTALPAQADFTDGAVAFSRISPEAGIKIWRQSAWRDDDFLSEVKLGDIYGDERGDNKYYDPIEAYVWYYLASISDRVAQNIGDRNARRVIADDFRRALREQSKLMLLMTADQREQARKRIIYILSCRGADGFIKLGEIHTANFGDEPVSAAPPGPPAWNSHGPRQTYVPPPDTYSSLGNVWGSWHRFNDDAWNEFDSGDAAQARRQMGIASDSVIVPNNGEALTYYHVAENMGDELAHEYMRDLDYNVRNSRWLGPRVSMEAAEKAQYWAPPFEFYPPDGNTSGVPYTDECHLGLDRERALAVAQAGIPPHEVQQALWFLGWSSVPFARWAAAQGSVEYKAIARFQATMGDEPTGRFTPLEIVRVIQTAAIKGDAESENTLGVMYAKGIGVPLNYVRAEHWFQKAADQRYGAALYHLGVLYKAGPPGIKQDLSKANDYMTASALAGFKPTMNQLRELLDHANAGPHREGH
ncbi:MAG TPA: tetratricopeptide repeat protein [Rhizomicrobium sp.]|nr:tetratricopeptide repeat protein [Rhizomicrobium sp.]